MEHASSYHIEDYLQPGKHCHLVGIGGVSMRPLGLVLRRMGMEISGSDMNASVSTDELISKGIAVSILGTFPEQAKLSEIAKYSHYQIQPVKFLEDGTLVEEQPREKKPQPRRRFRR